MTWITEEEIKEFLNSKNYDIKETHNARWIDQKCTPDVISTIADCILEYSKSENCEEYFSSLDIWHNQYTVENVEAIYRKPNANLVSARNEYDKFFQQPMEMFSYAGILEKIKRGNRNFYKILNYDLLEYISIREMNALKFIQLYSTKVLKDSGIYNYFENYLSTPTSDNYVLMKELFSQFTIKHTRINKPLECNRIFTKVLNPLAFMKGTYGTEKGRMSRDVISKSDLMYNRNNFRDIYSDKPRGITRKEYLNSLSEDEKPNINLIKYQSAKAKKILRAFNDNYNEGKSEVNDELSAGIATNMHHIFPENEFEEISGYLENLIALTPSQHFQKAHPNNNTKYVDKGYQQICLLCKANNIEKNILYDSEKLYTFANFIYVLTIGFDNGKYEDVDENDFVEIVRMINMEYIQKN